MMMHDDVRDDEERRMRKLAFNRYRVPFHEMGQVLWTDCGNDDLTVDVLNVSDLHTLR